MKRLLIVPALGAILALPGCTTAQLQQDEAYVLSIVSSIKAGAKVAATTANAAVDLICGYLPAVVDDLNQTQNAVGLTGLTPGPKTRAAMNSANSALASAEALCSAKAATGIPAKVAAVWAAYSSAKAALANAKTAGGA